MSDPTSGTTTSSSSLCAADDLRHRPADGHKGRDSLYFNAILPELDLGVFVYTWVDQKGTAGRLVSVWGPGKQPLAQDVVHGIEMGDSDFDDWSVAGLSLRQPQALQTAEIRFSSSKLALTYDFEGAHEAFDFARNVGGCPQWMALNRYEQTGRARGELRLDGRVIPFDGAAHRDHSWGRRNWRMPQHWKWIAAQTDAGHGLNLFQWVVRGELGTNGYVLRDGRPVPLVDARCRATYDDDMTSRTLHATLLDETGTQTELTMQRYGHFALPVGTSTVINEAACRATIDGVAGSGQLENQWPAAYVENLVRTEQ